MAAAGYLVVGVFIVSHMAVSTRRPDLSIVERAVVAAVLALPLALAFVWHRIERVKFRDVEFTLKHATRPMDAAAATILSGARSKIGSGFESKDVEMSVFTHVPSIPEEIIRIRTEAIKLLRIELGPGMWWSTRLFFLAALAMDYTGVQEFVFVTSGSRNEDLFLGMATPELVRRALAGRYDFLEKAYRHNDRLRQPDAALEDEINSVTQGFFRWFQSGMQRGGEESLKENVSASLLQKLLGDKFVTRGVDWPQHPRATPLLLYRIIDFAAPYVPLLEDRALLQVVERAAVADRLARQTLEQQLR